MPPTCKLNPVGIKPHPQEKVQDLDFERIKMRNVLKRAIPFVFSMAAVAAVGFIVSLPVKWLINGLFSKQAIVAVFGVPQIDVWIAWGLSCLIGLVTAKGSSKD